MIKNFDDLQKLGKDGVEATLQSFAATSKGFQTLAAEYADFARQSFEQSSSALEKLIAARTPERAFEIQSEFATGAYESFVAQTTKLGELALDVAKQSYKPIEAFAAKATPTA
jgi:phasin family protein